MVLVRDITDRGRTQELLRSEEFLRLAVESADLGTWEFYPATGEIMWSETMKRHFGLQPEAEVGARTFVQGLGCEVRELMEHCIAEPIAARGSDGHFTKECRIAGIGNAKPRWLSSWG